MAVSTPSLELGKVSLLNLLNGTDFFCFEELQQIQVRAEDRIVFICVMNEQLALLKVIHLCEK